MVGSHRREFGLDQHIERVEQTHDFEGLRKVKDPAVEMLVHYHVDVPRYAFWLRDVMLSADRGHVIVNGRTLRESMHPMRSRAAATLPGRPVLEFHDKVAVPVRPSTYYHWLIDQLPNLVIARELEPSAIAVLSANTPSHVYESLECLGFPWHRGRGTARYPRALIVDATSDFGWPRGSDLHGLRGRFNALMQPTKQREKIFISRRLSGNRQQGYERAESIAEEHGFVVVHPQTMSWREQVRLFANANSIVAAHGAGLSNVLFAPVGTEVVEVMDKSFSNGAYEVLCGALNMNYRRLMHDHDQVPDWQAALSSR